MPFKLNEHKQIVGDDGNVLEIGGQPVTLQDFQGVIDPVVQGRLAEEKERADRRLNTEIAKLENDLKTASAAEAKILQDKINTLTDQLNDKEAAANLKAAKRIKEIEGERDAMSETLEKERGLRRSLLVDTAIANAAAAYNVRDLNEVKVLMKEGHLVWEDIFEEETGKPTGEKKFGFKMKVKDPNTEKEVEKVLDAEVAMEHFAEAKPHLFKGENRGGSGSWTPGQSRARVDASKMTATQKITAGI